MIEKLKNKKTLFISLGSLCALLLLIVIIVVCVNANHKHTYSTTWSNNETSHWHDATCKHDVKSDEEDHTYGDWVVVSAATETTKGSKKRTCTVCKYEETSEIPLLDHTHKYATKWSFDETNHWHDDTCGHKTKSDVTTHTYGEWVTVTPSTEETKGTQKRTCTVCGYEDTKELELLPHTHKYSNDWSKDETGHWHADTCGHNTKSNEEGHSYGEWTIRVEPTISTEGEKYRTCSVCGYEDTQSIEKITYTVTWLNADETVLETDIITESGVMPSYDGATPSMPAHEKYEYEFIGWDKEISVVTGDITYTARYNTIEAYEYTISGDSVTINKYKGSSAIVTIPSKIDGVNVTSIAGFAFAYNYKITSVTVPSTITSIGNAAFADCFCLNEVINKSSVGMALRTYYGGGCAYFALTLKNEGESEIVNKNDYLFLTVDNVNYLVNYVGSKTSLVLPDDYNGETYMISKSFCYGSNISSVTIGSKAVGIDNAAFYSCSSLSTLVISKSVGFIGTNVCAGCPLSAVYYEGTPDEWNSITFNSDYVKNCDRYYYSESEPTDTTVNYWHYVNGVPTAW